MFKAKITPRRSRGARNRRPGESISLESMAGAPAAPGSAQIDRASQVKELGLEIAASTQAGDMFISGEEERTEELEKLGYRVKPLRDTSVIQIGDQRIETDGAVLEMAQPQEIPQPLRSDWTHHIVQLVGPPEAEWISEIERRGLDVVEPVSSYGLFVYGSKMDVDALQALNFVAWTGPFKPGYRIDPQLAQMSGNIRYVSVGVYPGKAAGSVKRSLREIGAKIVDEWDETGPYKQSFQVLIIEIWRRRIDMVARLPSVRWLEYYSGELQPDDERSVQIVAANFNGTPPPATGPVLGYQHTLNDLKLDGNGVVVGICDTGVDTNGTGTMHPDLDGRLAFFVDRTGGRHPIDTQGHGTHVAGIAVGSGSTSDSDPDGFLLGQGVAPGSDVGSINAVAPGGMGTRSLGELAQQMAAQGTHVMNNSWGIGAPGYSSNASLLDRLARDPDPTSANPIPMAMVFSAGNIGPRSQSIVSPKEAKNIIVVGNSHSYRPDELSGSHDIRGVYRLSSRGPARDQRILPTVVAPGTDIVSARPNSAGAPATVARPGSPYKDISDMEHLDYTTRTGTSMAAPHVTGLCALTIQWWRQKNSGAQPSQAMLKALLVNGAEDLAGGPDGKGGQLDHIPNNDQGWGRVNLKNMLREPKVLIDQTQTFTGNDQEFIIEVRPEDTAKPLRITLVWTDAPGATRQQPALTNDLDLEVLSIDQGDIYKGNIFQEGFSVTGGNFDDLNNVECVYVEKPSGNYEIVVIAANVRANANRPFDIVPWQDFALVVDNARQVT